jgi:uncharacterized protein YoxC
MFQNSLFDATKRVNIVVREQHDLVRLASLIDWRALILIVMNIRQSKIVKDSGPKPHYRQLLGAIALMAVKNLTYREAEDQIAHYAPAKFLCDLMDTDWTLDHVTIFDFVQMIGPEGLEKINQEILLRAEEYGLLDPNIVMSDTTALEAHIPYPNEVGLMARYTELMEKNLKKVRGKFDSIRGKIKDTASDIKNLLRNSHLFAKTKEAKRKVSKKMYHTVKDLHQEIKGLLKSGYDLRTKAGKEVKRLSELMEKLLPQMLHFINTGFVASKKIIHLQIPELYAIVRGKAGKKVEFGLKWGVNRIGGGFVQGFMIGDGSHCSDLQFCLEGVKRHAALFGESPKIYGYDRGGYSSANVEKVRKMGVKHVGIAPKGKNDWQVSDSMAERIKRERAQVEGSIGTIKSARYGFNKPNAHSKAAMASCGHRSILGFNLMKLTRGVGKIQNEAV